MMLVGDVANRTAIIIDDLADTATTITVSSPVEYTMESILVFCKDKTLSWDVRFAMLPT